MNSKFYVSDKAARLLYEKGFESDLHHTPTKAEAIDWLESKGMRINIIYDWLECRWYFTTINGSPTVKNITELEVSDSGFYKTRLEAEDAAIIKALEILNTRPTF